MEGVINDEINLGPHGTNNNAFNLHVERFGKINVEMKGVINDKIIPESHGIITKACNLHAEHFSDAINDVLTINNGRPNLSRFAQVSKQKRNLWMKTLDS